LLNEVNSKLPKLFKLLNFLFDNLIDYISAAPPYSGV